MGYVSKIKLNGTSSPITSSLCGTCSTAAATAAKVVTCSNFDALMSGVSIFVTFSYDNTAASPTLNVNGTGAKSIQRGGYPIQWPANAPIQFVYDGTNWCMVANDSAAPELGGQTTGGTAGEAVRAGEFVYTTNGTTWYKAVDGISRSYTAIGIALNSPASGASISVNKIIGPKI